MIKKVILFDFDGTLVDSLELFIEISNYFSDIFSYKKILPNEVEHLRSLSAYEMRKYLRVPLYKMFFLVPKFRKRTYRFINELELFEGIENLIKSLHEKGYVLGIISMNSTKNVKKYLDEKNISSFFDFISSANVFQGKEKVIKKWINDNKYEYSKVIYVGDEVRDIIACQHAGIPIIAVTWGYNSKSSLVKHNPDSIIDSVVDLNEVLYAFFN